MPCIRCMYLNYSSRRNYLTYFCMRNIATTFGYIILFLFTLDSEVTLAQPASQGVNHAPATTFELKNGDRVVFLGNSLFENDLSYGYLELALTTRWPTSDVTFRNIGWTGDTVWGQARSYISSPSAYDLLMEQLTNTQPTTSYTIMAHYLTQQPTQSTICYHKCCVTLAAVVCDCNQATTAATT